MQTSNIYDAGLNEFCRRYLIRGEHDVPLQEARFFKLIYRDAMATVFERLMLFDRATFKVYGENIPLAILINAVSVKGVEQLLDEGALNFALWTPSVLTMVDNIHGLVPLVSGRTSSPVHSDPEQSIDLGLGFLSDPPNKRQRDAIRRKARDRYAIPRDGIEHEVRELTLSAYRSDKLKSFGLDSRTSDIYNLNAAQKKVLGQCAEDLLEYEFAISQQLYIDGESRFRAIFLDTAAKLARGKNIDAFAQIADLENFPNLREVFANIDEPMRSLPRLRKSSNARKFRAWLNATTSKGELYDVTRAYVDAIANAKGFFETGKGRFTKTVAMAMLGAGAGSVAGPAGAALGGVAAKLLEPAVDFGLDLLDEYLLSELARGWTPRMFFDALKKEQTASLKDI